MKSHVAYLSVTALAVALAVGMPVTKASAALGSNANKLVQVQEARASKAAERKDANLTLLIQKSDQLIQVRLSSLQKLFNRVQNDKRLSDSDKTSLTGDINTTVTDLTTLKAKIDADTDLATARTDAKSIITTYRIYMVFEPKIRILTTIGNLQTESSTVSSLSARVQTLLSQQKSEGKDVTAAQTALTDVTTQLTAINTLLATDKTLVSNVTPQTTNPQSVFVQIRKDMATIRADFAKIRSDFATIRGSLKILKPSTSPSATSSAK